MSPRVHVWLAWILKRRLRTVRDRLRASKVNAPERVEAAIGGATGRPETARQSRAICWWGGALARGARVLASIEVVGYATQLAAASVRLCPGRPDGWDVLGDVASSHGATGLRLDPHIGLSQGVIGLSDEEIRCRSSAAIAAPTSRRHRLLAEAHERNGDVVQATRSTRTALALAPDDPGAWYRQGRLEATRAAQRGGFTAEGFTRHRESMLAALRLDPHHVHARYHLVRVAIRAQDWQTAFSAADQRGLLLASQVGIDLNAPPGEPAIDLAMEFVETANRDWWLVLHWFLLTHRNVRAAFDAKDRLARQIANELATSYPNAANTVSWVQAFCTLNELDDAAAAVERLSDVASSDHDRRLATKLRFDLALRRGIAPAPSQLTDWRARNPGEAEFRRLIEGRKVAIVGPLGAPGTGDEIDGYDTVVRAKHIARSSLDPDRQGSRTDAAYFAENGFQLLRPEIESTIAAGRLRVATSRSTSETVRQLRYPHQSGLRLLPVEDSTVLAASPFAIQRIIYDVLGYGPSRVKIFNCDYYASQERYDSDYHVESTTVASRQIVPTLEGYGHDLRADHRFARNLFTSGVIEASEVPAAALRLETENYLTTLESHQTHD